MGHRDSRANAAIAATAMALSLFLAVTLGLMGPYWGGRFAGWFTDIDLPGIPQWIRSAHDALGPLLPGLDLSGLLHMSYEAQIFTWGIVGALIPLLAVASRAWHHHRWRTAALRSDVGVVVDLLRGRDPYGESDTQAAAREYLERRGGRRPGQPWR